MPRKYASLDDTSSVIDPVLSKYGLSYSWSDRPCTRGLADAALSCGVEDTEATSSPPMPIEGTAAYAPCAKIAGIQASPQQRMGIADSYTMRYSMIAGLGLTTCDEDEDGARIGSDKTRGPTITEAQAQTLNNLLIELADGRGVTHQQQIAAFKNGYRVDLISALPAAKFNEAVKNIQAKIAAEKK